jgi:hypothetical protein
MKSLVSRFLAAVLTGVAAVSAGRSSSSSSESFGGSTRTLTQSTHITAIPTTEIHMPTAFSFPSWAPSGSVTSTKTIPWPFPGFSTAPTFTVDDILTGGPEKYYQMSDCVLAPYPTPTDITDTATPTTTITACPTTQHNDAVNLMVVDVHEPHGTIDSVKIQLIYRQRSLPMHGKGLIGGCTPSNGSAWECNIDEVHDDGQYTSYATWRYPHIPASEVRSAELHFIKRSAATMLNPTNVFWVATFLVAWAIV